MHILIFVTMFTSVYANLKLCLEHKIDITNLQNISVAFTSIQDFPVITTISSNEFAGLPQKFIEFLYLSTVSVSITQLFANSSKITFVFLDDEEEIFKSIITSFFWDPKFYFFLIFSKPMNEYKIFCYLWRTFKVRSVFLISGKNYLTTFNPSGYKVEKYSTDTESLRNVLKRRIFDWTESEIHIVLRGTIPPTNDTGSLSNILDENLLQNIAVMLNSSLFLKGTADKRRYGMKFENGTYIGTFKDIIENDANMTGNRHFLKWYNISPELTFSHYITSDKLCFAIPKAGQIPHLLASLESFKTYTILCLMLSYIGAGISFSVTRALVLKMQVSEEAGQPVSTVLMMTSFLLNTSFPYKPSMMYENFFIAIMLLISFILVNFYQSSLITILTAPGYYKNIQSLEELKKIDIEIWTSSEDLINSLNEIGLSDLNYHLKTTYEQQHSNNTYDKGWLEKLTIFEDVEQLSYVHGKSYIVPECPLSYLTAYVLPSESVLQYRLNNIISQLIESGHILRWTRSLYETSESEIRIRQVKDKQDIKIKPLTVGDLASCFKIIGWSYLMAFFVLIIEMTFYRIKMKVYLKLQ